MKEHSAHLHCSLGEEGCSVSAVPDEPIGRQYLSFARVRPAKLCVCVCVLGGWRVVYSAFGDKRPDTGFR